MDEPLDDQYFTWLYRQVASTRAKDPNKTYWAVLRCLFTQEFIWFVPNDDNRVRDGVALRTEFLESLGIDEVDPDWLTQGCAFLEMMIGIARRLALQMEGRSAGWFWHLMDNLELSMLNDNNFHPGVSEDYTREVLDTVIWRTYNHNGKGGLFPLKFPKEDQRNVELWYQLNAYLIENY